MTGRCRVFARGRWGSPEEAHVSAFDRGFLYGEGLIETMRVSGGGVPNLSLHLARMEAALSALGVGANALLAASDLNPGAGLAAELARIIGDGCGQAAVNEGLVRLAVTPGTAPGWLAEPAEPTLVIAVRSGIPYPPEAYRRGMSTAVVHSVRRDEGSLPARFKLSSYLTSRWAAREAAGQGADEGILLNTKGRAAEGSRSNLFLWDGRGWRTPPVWEGALPGIARSLVISCCRRWQVPLTEAPVEPALLRGTPEAFLTNALMGMMPVASVDGIQLASTNAQSMTMRLSRRFMPVFLGEV